MQELYLFPNHYNNYITNNLFKISKMSFTMNEVSKHVVEDIHYMFPNMSKEALLKKCAEIMDAKKNTKLRLPTLRQHLIDAIIAGEFTDNNAGEKNIKKSKRRWLKQKLLSVFTKKADKEVAEKLTSDIFFVPDIDIVPGLDIDIHIVPESERKVAADEEASEKPVSDICIAPASESNIPGPLGSDILLAENLYLHYSDFLTNQDLASLRLVSKSAKQLVEDSSIFEHTLRKRAMLLQIPLHVRFPMRDGFVFGSHASDEEEEATDQYRFNKDETFRKKQLESGSDMTMLYEKFFKATNYSAGASEFRFDSENRADADKFGKKVLEKGMWECINGDFDGDAAAMSPDLRFKVGDKVLVKGPDENGEFIWKPSVIREQWFVCEGIEAKKVPYLIEVDKRQNDQPVFVLCPQDNDSYVKSRCGDGDETSSSTQEGSRQEVSRLDADEVVQKIGTPTFWEYDETETRHILAMQLTGHLFSSVDYFRKTMLRPNRREIEAGRLEALRDPIRPINRRISTNNAFVMAKCFIGESCGADPYFEDFNAWELMEWLHNFAEGCRKYDLKDYFGEKGSFAYLKKCIDAFYQNHSTFISTLDAMHYDVATPIRHNEDEIRARGDPVEIEAGSTRYYKSHDAWGIKEGIAKKTKPKCKGARGACPVVFTKMADVLMAALSSGTKNPVDFDYPVGIRATEVKVTICPNRHRGCCPGRVYAMDGVLFRPGNLPRNCAPREVSDLTEEEKQFFLFYNDLSDPAGTLPLPLDRLWTTRKIRGLAAELYALGLGYGPNKYSAAALYGAASLESEESPFGLQFENMALQLDPLNSDVLTRYATSFDDGQGDGILRMGMRLAHINKVINVLDIAVRNNPRHPTARRNLCQELVNYIHHLAHYDVQNSNNLVSRYCRIYPRGDTLVDKQLHLLELLLNECEKLKGMLADEMIIDSSNHSRLIVDSSNHRFFKSKDSSNDSSDHSRTLLIRLYMFRKCMCEVTARIGEGNEGIETNPQYKLCKEGFDNLTVGMEERLSNRERYAIDNGLAEDLTKAVLEKFHL